MGGKTKILNRWVKLGKGLSALKRGAVGTPLRTMPLLRTLLAICQKYREPSFLGSNGLFCFISICKFGSFKNPFTIITSLPQLLHQKIYPFGKNEKTDFYELWQQPKQMKTM